MALQAEHVDQTHFKEPGIGRTVGRVTTAASLGLYRHVLIDKRSLLIGVALVANRVSAGESANLPQQLRSVRIVTVIALYESLVDAMMIRLGEISLGRRMASVTQFRRALRQQPLALFGVMRRVAVEAANIAAGMRGRGEMRLLFTVAVAG
jgi:hypothetical protein